MKEECSTLGELCSMLYMHIVVDLFAIYSKLPMERRNITKLKKFYLKKYFNFSKINNKKQNKTIKMPKVENTIQKTRNDLDDIEMYK